jgi:hypothetical protein
MLNNPNKPVYQAVGETQAMIQNELTKMAQMSREDAEPLSPDAVFFASAEQVEMLMDLAAMAKILPFKADSPEYQDQMQKAFAESQRLYGQSLLDSEDSELHQDEASTILAAQVARESDEGTLDPNFHKGMAVSAMGKRGKSMVPNGAVLKPVAAGVKGAIEGGR